MPIYEYACKECDHVLDALQKLSDDPLVHCPSCGKPSLRKLLSAPRFRLKGSGWYETDFKDKNQRNVLKSDSDSSDSKSKGSSSSASPSSKSKDSSSSASSSGESKSTKTESKGEK